MSTIAPLYPIHSPPHNTPLLLTATSPGQSTESQPNTMSQPQLTAMALNKVTEHAGAFPIATEGYWTSRSTSTTTSTTTSAYRPKFPFEEIQESYENRMTKTGPPALGRLACVLLPTQCGSEVVLHRLLLAPREAGLCWDLLWSHEGVESAMEGSWRTLRDPATFPAIPSMAVVHRWLPWPITVHASGLDSRGVTVVDVLVAISKDMLQPVGEGRSKIKMDFLRGRRTFFGLRKSRLGGDVWELVVG